MAGLLLAAFRGLRSDLKEELKAREARQEKRLDDFRNEFKEAFKASETRQEKQMDDLKAATQALGDKVDRLVEVILAAKLTPTQGA